MTFHGVARGTRRKLYGLIEPGIDNLGPHFHLFCQSTDHAYTFQVHYYGQMVSGISSACMVPVHQETMWIMLPQE